MDCMKSLLSGIGCCLLTLPVYPPPLCSQNETVNQIENLNVKPSRQDERTIVRPATNSPLRSSEITFPDGHQAFEIADRNVSSTFFMDYGSNYIRHQVFYPSHVLQLPIGTKIYSVSLRVSASDIVSSTRDMRISLGEISDENIPEHEYVNPLETYYDGSDLINIEESYEDNIITYSFEQPFTYNGNCLIVEFFLSTEEKESSALIFTGKNEFESIYSIRSEWDEGEESNPYNSTIKPDVTFEVEITDDSPIPYIPFPDREQILGYASVGSSSTVSYVTLENKGGSAFTVSGLEGSSHFSLSNSNITVPAGSSEQVGLVFTPQSEGTWEENVSLVTNAGNLGLTLTGTTYRQAPYEREVESSDNVEEQIWQEMETITELSVSGTVGYSDRYSFTRMPNLVSLDLSTASTDIADWRRDNPTDFSQIEQLALPQGLKSFDFEGMDNLYKLILPIGYEAIRSALPSGLSSLISFSLNPPDVYNQEYLQYIEIVYVPANAVENWKYYYPWNQKKIVPITDEVLGGSSRQVTIRNDMVYTPESYPTGEIQVNIRPDMELETATAGLTNQAPLNMTKLSMSYRLQNRADYGGDYDGLYLEQGAYSSFINENEEATLQAARYTLQVEHRTWHYVAFPFDVPASTLQAQDPSVEYVIRYYDGKRRGEYGTDTYKNWKDVDPNGTLKAGQGYIIQTEYPSSSNLFTFTWESEEEAIQSLLRTGEIEIPLSDYPSEYTNNANWNFVGNPYPSFFNIQAIDYNAPIIIWNGNGYTALSLTDDTYALRPLEAFFTQKPEETSSMIFQSWGRQTNADVTGSSFRALPNPERKLLNLRLVGESYTDRSRIVINPNAELSYELTCDAGKWMSSNPKVPQLYSLGEDGQRYAINERPAGSGQIPLGFYVGEAGTYTLKIMSDKTTPEVYLVDKYKNEQVLLNQKAYTFYAETGTINDRFEIRLSESAITGNELAKADAPVRIYTQESSLYIQVAEPSSVRIYTALGVLATERQLEAGTTKIDLPSGLYLVNLNQATTHKVFIH